MSNLVLFPRKIGNYNVSSRLLSFYGDSSKATKRALWRMEDSSIIYVGDLLTIEKDDVETMLSPFLRRTTKTKVLKELEAKLEEENLNLGGYSLPWWDRPNIDDFYRSVN